MKDTPKESKTSHPHDEWMQKILAVSEANKKEYAPHEKRIKEEVPEKEKHTPFAKGTMVLFLLLLILASVPRLYFIFFLSAPENAGVGWYGDTYHHWQIAYLTKEIGLSHGFLRLWDLKGMEYFWGPFHPVLMTIIFGITGWSNIVLTRLVSVFFGVGIIALLSLLANRYWGKSVGFATLIFSAFFPIAIFNDATGMVDGIGVFFLLLGVYLWPKRPVWTGIAFVLASMVRAEAWIFTFGLLVAVLFSKEHAQKKGFVWAAWGIGMAIYMKYLLSYTGNPIYPVYWNFLANALGAWADVVRPLTPLQQSVKPILMGLGVASAGVLGVILWKRPRSMLLLLLGFGNIFFVTAFMGFSHYITGWEWWFPYIRFFVFPYIFLGMLVFVSVWLLTRRRRMLAHISVIITAVAVLIGTQMTWGPIMVRFQETVPEWEKSVVWGKEVGKYYTGGTVLFPEGDPNFTYTTIEYGNVAGKHILGQMFDPFYYLGGEGTFTNWGKNRKEIFKWIKTNDIRLAIIGNDNKRYSEMIKREPELFEQVGKVPNSRYEIWRVYPEKVGSYE